MRLTAASCLLLCLSLAACGGKDEAPAPDAATAAADAATAAATQAAAAPVPVEEATAELPPLPVGDFRIATVTLGKAVDGEGQVRAPLETFGPRDRIFASVVSLGSSEGLMLSARWTTAEGAEVAQAGQSLSPAAPTVTTFSIAQPEPWPVGAYQVEIAINGRVAETRSFQVQ